MSFSFIGQFECKKTTYNLQMRYTQIDVLTVQYITDVIDYVESVAPALQCPD